MSRQDVPDAILVQYAERCLRGEPRRKLAQELESKGYSIHPNTIYCRMVALREMKSAIEQGVEQGRELGLAQAATTERIERRVEESDIPDQPPARITLPTPRLADLDLDLGGPRSQVEAMLDPSRDRNPWGVQSLSRLPVPRHYNPCPSQHELKASFERNNFFITQDQLFAVHQAISDGRPILADGPPGCGKTTLSEQIAIAMGLDPTNPFQFHKLFCTPDMGKNEALYSWNDGKRLLDIQLVREMATKFPIEDTINIFKTVGDNAYSGRYLDLHALLRPCVIPHRTIVLGDEIDKTYPEFDSFLLDILVNNQFEVPGFGPVGRKVYNPETAPIFVFTTNRERDLNRALARRLNPVWFDYLPEKLEAKVIATKCNVDEMAAGQAAQFFFKMRDNSALHLHQPPSTAETIATVQALVRDGVAIKIQNLFKYNTYWIKFRRDYDIIREKYNKKGEWSEII